MKRFMIALLALAWAPAAYAQFVTGVTVSVCGAPNNSPIVGGTYPLTQDSTGKLCTSGSGGGTVLQAGAANTPTNPFFTQLTAGSAAIGSINNAAFGALGSNGTSSLPAGTAASTNVSIGAFATVATVAVDVLTAPGATYYFSFNDGVTTRGISAAQINTSTFATTLPVSVTYPAATFGRFLVEIPGPGTLYIVPTATTTTTAPISYSATSAAIPLPYSFINNPTTLPVPSAAVANAGAGYGNVPATSFGAACYVAKAGPGNFYALTYDTTATSGYTVVYNLNAIPTTGTTGIATLWFSANKVAGTAAMAAAIVPYYASVGVTICQTAAAIPTTYTTGTASNYSAQVQ